MRAILLILTVSGLLYGAYTAQTINGDSVVYDDATSLTWQDNEVVKMTTRTWDEAIEYCENLDFADKTDWRLPNFNELYMIADRSREDPAIDPTFTNTAYDHYWSSTTDASASSVAWGVDFRYGRDYSLDKMDSFYVRCVRSGQIVPSASAVSVPLSPWTRFAMLLLFALAGFAFVRRTKARSL